jgi:hypothetical protein
VRQHESRPVHPGHHLGDGKRLARSGDAQQHLLALAALEALDEVLDGRRLIAFRGERRNDFESIKSGGLRKS